MASTSQILDLDAQRHPVAVHELAYAYAHNPQREIALEMHAGV